MQVHWLLPEPERAPWLAARGIPLEALRTPWLRLNKHTVAAALAELDLRGRPGADAEPAFWSRGIAQTPSSYRIWASILRQAATLGEAWAAAVKLELLPAGLYVTETGTKQAEVNWGNDTVTSFALDLVMELPKLYGFSTVVSVGPSAASVRLWWSVGGAWWRPGLFKWLFSWWEDRIAARRALALRAEVFEAALADVADNPTRIIARKYQIVGTLGAGATAVVHDAIANDSGARVAVKELRVASHEDGVLADRLRREGDALSLSASPHIVRLLERGDTPQGKPYLVLEHLAGKTLRTCVTESGPLATRELRHVAQALLSAARVMHAAGVVHRDLSPSNVVLTPETPCRVTVVDFGTAQIEWEETRLTQPGTTIGTPGFLAPELAAGARASARSDLYSLGATLHFAGTGSAPAAGAYDRLRPADAWDVFLKGLLCSDPTKRFANADEALAALPEAQAPGDS